MKLLNTLWSERSNALSLLNTAAIVAVAYVLNTMPVGNSNDYSSQLDEVSGHLAVVADKLSHPLDVSVSQDSLSYFKVEQSTPASPGSMGPMGSSLLNPVHVTIDRQ